MELYINRAIPLYIIRKVNILLIIVFIFDFLLFPAPVLAGSMGESIEIKDLATMLYRLDEKQPVANTLPENPDLEIKSSGSYTVTAYNSEIGQCDNTPCITANGFDLCEHGIEDSVATNMLPFGAKVRFPDVFGDRVFIVRDRMNARYYARFDVWMLDHDDAVKFGAKYTKVEILL